MRRRFTIRLLLLVLFGVQNASGAGVSVLFVGNSLTQVNDLPSVLSHFAAESLSHVQMSVSAITPGGAFLYDHWKSGQALALLREKRPTFLVLQGQSTEPLSAPQSFARSAAAFKAEADRLHVKTILFSTWARPAGDAYYKEPVSGGSPAEMQARLSSGYAAVARATGATLAPVGMGFERANQLAPQIQLLDGTQHPSAAGTYLAAAILFRAMFNDSITQSSYYGGMPPEVALRLQHIAGEIPISPAP